MLFKDFTGDVSCHGWRKIKELNAVLDSLTSGGNENRTDRSDVYSLTATHSLQAQYVMAVQRNPPLFILNVFISKRLGVTTSKNQEILV